MVRDDDESCLSVASTLGITRSSVCGHEVVAQRRLRAALADWLEHRVARVSPLRAQPAEADAQVAVQPVDVAALGAEGALPRVQVLCINDEVLCAHDHVRRARAEVDRCDRDVSPSVADVGYARAEVE